MIFIHNVLYLGVKSEVLVDGACIVTFGKEGSVQCPANVADIERIDANGQILFPSFIDVHVHLRQPGYEWKESIETGLNAALYGGIGRVCCMANTNPVNDSASVTKDILASAQSSHPHGPFVYPIAAASIGLKGEVLAPLGELTKAGCVAVSNDGVPLTNTEMVRRVMEYASDFGLILIDHCEDPFLAKETHMTEGRLSASMGIKGQPDIAEALQANRDMLLAEYLDLPLHIAHVSAKKTVELIELAKLRGVDVTAETCPHYLLLDESILAGYNTNAKVNPPLRTPADVQAIRQAVKNGTIDCLVTDHAPHAEHEKNQPFDLVPNGITGLDTALSLLWQLVEEGVLSQENLIEGYCIKPAKRFNLPHNSFQKGDPADFFLFDPNTEWEISAKTMYSKSCNTPWLGKTVKGKVTAHYLGGINLFNVYGQNTRR